MITRSMNVRLLLSTSALLVLCLSIGGYALERAFANSVKSSLTEKLTANIYALLSEADERDGILIMPTHLASPNFNRLESGLYGLITNPKGQELWRSNSGLAITLDSSTSPSPGEFILRELEGGPTSALFALSYSIIWEQEDGRENRYTIHVYQTAASVQAEITGFRNTLWRWFVGIGVMLLIAQYSIMRWGLSPLRHLAKELRAIEAGHEDQLTGRYPTELQGVTHNLNLLLTNERRQRQRYRDTLADLAHSLKTPLTILRGLVFQPDNKTATTEQPENDQWQDVLNEQVSRMDDIVSHQLNRATAQNDQSQASLALKPLHLAPLVDKLLRTMGKVYADKSITALNQIHPELNFRADERDIMEVLGNLLDNAFKASQQQVQVSAHIENSNVNNKHLIICVEDDGPGIAVDQRQQVLERGIRADTQHAGQGIGLAVSQDIIHSYRGSLKIDESPLGGARMTLEMPLP